MGGAQSSSRTCGLLGCRPRRPADEPRRRAARQARRGDELTPAWSTGANSERAAGGGSARRAACARRAGGSRRRRRAGARAAGPSPPSSGLLSRGRGGRRPRRSRTAGRRGSGCGPARRSPACRPARAGCASARGRGRVQVMQHGDRGDVVERRRLERVGHEVAEDELDVLVQPAGQLDARRVAVDARDERHHLAQLAGEQALAAADVEGAPAARRNGPRGPAGGSACCDSTARGRSPRP